MANFRIFTNSKSAVSDLISASRINPRASMNKANKGVIFKGFDDWRQVAYQSLVISPYSIFWRRLALRYPENLLVKDLSLFIDSLESFPLLADQARALIFKLPAKKLPKPENLIKLPGKSQEQARVVQLLIQKKRWGDKKFYQEFFSQVVSDEGDGQISFPMSDKETISKFAHRLAYDNPLLTSRRLNTVFGKATLVAIDKGHGTGGIYYYLLPDGDKYVKRICLLDYDKISIK